MEMPNPPLRPRNNWPLLRLFMNIVFMMVCMGLAFIGRMGWGAGLFLILPALLAVQYFKQIRPHILHSQETQPEVELAIQPVPWLRKPSYRLWRYFNCFNNILMWLSMGLLARDWIVKSPHATPGLLMLHTLVLIAWGVGAVFQTLAELRELRRELAVLAQMPVEQPVPQAQHYGPQ
jgi:hypothetical protein